MRKTGTVYPAESPATYIRYGDPPENQKEMT